MQIQLLKEISKKNKEYYGIFLVKDDFKILLKFISKKQFDKLTEKNS